MIWPRDNYLTRQLFEKWPKESVELSSNRTPSCLGEARFGGDPIGGTPADLKLKVRALCVSYGEYHVIIGWAVCTQGKSVTDRQTDRFIWQVRAMHDVCHAQAKNDVFVR